VTPIIRSGASNARHPSQRVPSGRGAPNFASACQHRGPSTKKAGREGSGLFYDIGDGGLSSCELLHLPRSDVVGRVGLAVVSSALCSRMTLRSAAAIASRRRRGAHFGIDRVGFGLAIFCSAMAPCGGVTYSSVFLLGFAVERAGLAFQRPRRCLGLPARHPCACAGIRRAAAGLPRAGAGFVELVADRLAPLVERRVIMPGTFR
jgi:hypothetical protein